MVVYIKGKYAMFARPELRAERYSYDAPTPSAMEGLLKAIYWKPEMRYCIRKIHVQKEPQYMQVMTNSQTQVINRNKLMKESITINRNENATPRTMRILKNVEYYIEVDIKLTGKGTSADNTVKKHEAILTRRLQHGQSYRDVCLGAREFPCEVELVNSSTDIPKSELKGVKEMGRMLHHMDYDGKKPKPVFYNAVMRDGVIDTAEEGKGSEWLFGSLIKFYDRNKDLYNLPCAGYGISKIKFVAIIDDEGKLVDFHALSLGRNDKPLPLMIEVPEEVKGRTSGIKANFLWDNDKYIFGMDEKGKSKQKAFCDKITEVLGADMQKDARAVYQFVKNYNRDEVLPYIEKYVQVDNHNLLSLNGGNIIFKIKGHDEYVHDNPEIRAKWETYYQKSKTGPKGKCIITGNEEILAVDELHPLIKGVAGASAFAKLVSVDQNSPSFECYGMSGLENSAFGMTSLFKYSTALNWLLSQNEHKVNVGNSTFLFWAENNSTELLKNIRKLLMGEEIGESDIPEDERFCITELKGNASRLFVADYQEFTFGSANEKMMTYLGRVRKLYQGSSMKLRENYMEKWDKKAPVCTETREYYLGGLMAIFEKIQKDAVKSVIGNRTVADRYVERAAQTPQVIFPKLISASKHHLNKVDYGMGKRLASQLALLEQFEDPFPKRLNPKEQCIFYMGYHKTLDLFYKKKENIEDEQN